MKSKITDTASICPICLKTIPAERVIRNGAVYLEKNCPEHGFFEALIWQDAATYRTWRTEEINTKPTITDTKTVNGCPHDCGLCPAHLQQACCVLIEVTEKCNQHCRYCFANSSPENTRANDLSLLEIRELFKKLLAESQDRPYNIQLSGGEPTLRNDLPEIIRLAKELGFPYIQLNTNGLRLAEPGYCDTLYAAELSSVFLQFDGTTDEIYETIRGEKLLEIKLAALEEIKKAGLSAVLVVTVVPGINDKNVGEIIRFAAEGLPYIRGIHFQPVAYMGRFPKAPADEDRITLDCLIRLIEEQTGGSMNRSQFIPLSTGSSYCSFHGRFVYTEEKTFLPISAKHEAACCEKTAIIKARNFIGRQWEWQPSEETKQNNTVSTEKKDFDNFDYFLQRVSNYGMSITAMGFQDCWNMDLERLQRCRVHVADKSGKLIPFCAYYNLSGQEKRKL